MALKQTNCELDVIKRFEFFAESQPERVALKDQAGQISYAELNVLADGVAGRIAKHSSDSMAPVVVLSADDRMRCIGLLAAWKAGRAYVPIDPSLPELLVTTTLQNLESGIVLTDGVPKPVFRAANHTLPVLRIDDPVEAHVRAPHVILASHDLAWIIHTSGSSGPLKGVMQSHHNACHYVRTVVDGLRIGPEDRVAAASPLTLHAGVVYTLAVLSSGARLCLIAPKEPPETLVDRLVKEEITVLFTVPTVFRRLADSIAKQGGLPALRVLRLSGETVTSRDVQLYRQSTSSRCLLSIGFGATETGGITHAYIDRTTPIEGPYIPVGHPVDGVEVQLIDDQGHPAITGEPGEIVAIGDYISPGYLGLPELTNSLFSITDDGRRQYRTGDLGKKRSDGSFEHFGRKDLQVQVAGRRVELAAVELAVSSVARVREAAVVAQCDSSGNVRLVAHIVAERDQPPTTDALRRQLRELLPDYMIPSGFIYVDSLPLTPNGKLDRQSLAELTGESCRAAVAHVTPRTSLEETLVQIWKDVLGVDRISVHENFFDLGGNSLTATQIIARVVHACAVELPLPSLWEAFTVAQMAEIIMAKRAEIVGESKPIDLLDELEAMPEEDAQWLLGEKPTRRTDHK